MNAHSPLPTIDLEQRLRDATRVGRPEWLWFEVPETRWAEAVATIETALREVLVFGRSDDKLIDDCVALSIACYTSGTGPLLGSWIEQGKLTTTPANAEIMRIHLDHNRTRMARLTARASEVVDALSAGGLRPIVLKGMHTAHHYFDEPGQRIASDIDMLVRPGEATIAAEILADRGYQPRKAGYCQRTWAMPGIATQPVTLTYVHRDDPWSIDLHESVSRRFAGGSRTIEIDALIPTVALEPWRVSPAANVFPPPLLLVHILMHASCSFESLTLQRQYEISLVIRKNGGREAFDWPVFIELCDRTHLWPFLYPALRCVERLSPGLIPDLVMQRARNAAPSTVRKLIEAHSAASAHRVGRWSWTERYMWADGMLARLRQVVDELRPRERLSLRQTVDVWIRRVRRQVGRVTARRTGPDVVANDIDPAPGRQHCGIAVQSDDRGSARH